MNKITNKTITIRYIYEKFDKSTYINKILTIFNMHNGDRIHVIKILL